MATETPPQTPPVDQLANDAPAPNAATAANAANSAVRELLTWRDVSDATDGLIESATKTLDLFDRDLRLKGWQQLDRYEKLREAIVKRGVHVRIMLCDVKTLRSDFPRVDALLATHGHRLSILNTRNQSDHIQSFSVADRQHTLLRPNMVQSRGALEFSNPAKSMVWTNRFEETWQQGGRKIFAETFGL